MPGTGALVIVARPVRRALKAAIGRLGYKLVKRSPALWTAPSVNMAEPWARRLVAEAPVHTIFDVGANDGKTIRWMSPFFPAATFYTFEPFPPSYQLLKQNMGTDPRVKPFNIALGEREGFATYYANSNPGTGSLLRNSPLIATYSPAHMVIPVGQTMVAVERLDSFCAIRGIERIDILKIDAQGYETRILEGAGDMLQPGRIRSLFLEILFVDLYESQAWADEVMRMVREHGYRLYGLSGVNFNFRQGWRWADAMFIADTAAWIGRQG